jgi:UDP-N-acetylmuramoyl-tripeptide--D-alanyl-D-alanine ligase
VKPRLLSDVARATGGSLSGPDVEVSSVSIDSRRIEPGGLFVALPGKHADGHDFVREALRTGAAALVHRDVDAAGSLVRVAGTGEALLSLAGDERGRMGATLAGITGANGKTTTKDMTAAVCRTRFVTHASPASFNNEIGLPLTLLGAPEGTEVVVAEMGARRIGDVSLLCDVARPQVVVVTNVGVAHMEVFGSWEAIVASSTEPVEALGPEGTAILNADDPVVAGFASRCRGRVVTFGMGPGATVSCEGLTLGRDGRAEFDVCWEGGRERVRLAVPGEHMVPNALAAAAVGLTLGVPLADIPGALGEALLSPWRMETFETPSGVRVVNDAYNANPESMAAALKAGRWMAGEGRFIAVLGQMAELGPISHDEHERIGELAARLRVDRLITVGPEARTIAVAGIREGVPPDDVASYDGAEGAVADVLANARSGDLVLCKGSRVAGLEALAEALR